MQSQARTAYQHSEILDADPARLVVLLYRGAIEAIGKARQHLAAGEIRERSHQITRAYEIIDELASAVKPEAGGDLALNLLRLYDFAQQQLLLANVDQKSEPLTAAETVLQNLVAAWESVAAQQPKTVAAAPPPLAERKPLSLSA